MRKLAWRAAPRAGLASPLTMIAAAVTALLTCFLATAAVLHASAAGGATVEYQAGIACPDAHGPAITRRFLPLEEVPRMVAIVDRHAAEHGFGPPRVAMYTPDLPDTEFGGTAYKTRLGYTDGGLEQLEIIEGAPGGPGLSMGGNLALLEEIPVGTRGQGAHGVLPPVVSIHGDLYDPAPRWWCSQQDLAVQQRIIDPSSGAVIFATDRDTFYDAARATRAGGVEWLNITFPGPVPQTVDEAFDQVWRSEALVAGVRADLEQQGLDERLNAGVPFARSVQIADKAQTNVLGSILPLAAISVLVGIAGIGTVGLQWYQRRYTAVRLLAARGSGPLGLGGLAVAELGLPLLTGGVAGSASAWILLDGYGPPGEVSAGAEAVAVAAAGVVLLVSLTLLAGVVALRGHREFQRGRSRGRGWRGRLLIRFPWELLTASLGLLGWLRLTEYSQSSGSLNPLPQVDPFALTYPVFVVLTAGLLAARVAWLLLRLSPRAVLWSRPAVQLAIRRLASARAPVTGVLAIGVVAIGTLAAGNGIAEAQRQSLDTKSGIFVGATSRVDTEQPVGLGATPLPAPIRDTSTVVGELTGTGSVVLVVDPRTFESVAWLDGASGARDALHLLDAAPGPGIPAIRVGHTDAQTRELPGLPDARPVADLPIFPIIGPQPGYVVSRDALTAAQLESIPKWSVLSSSSLDALAAALAAAGVTQPNPVSRSTALDALPFYVVEWSFAFVGMLGAVLALVAVLALLVAVEVRRRQNALAGALVLRMGLRPRALLGSYVMELGALAGAAVLTGVVCGAIVAGISVPRFDPAGWLAPRSELPDLTPFVLGVFAIGAGVVVLAGWLAMRSVRTAKTAELLRA